MYDGSNMQGNDNYYSNGKSKKCPIIKSPDNVRFAGKEKYPDKMRLWLARSNRDIFKLLFRP